MKKKNIYAQEVRSPKYQMRVIKNKKRYNRKDKHGKRDQETNN